VDRVALINLRLGEHDCRRNTYAVIVNAPYVVLIVVSFITDPVFRVLTGLLSQDASTCVAFLSGYWSSEHLKKETCCSES